ncbi:hypothetical protein ACWELJ_24860 [Nocardia sp. NPDC004582]
MRVKNRLARRILCGAQGVAVIAACVTLASPSANAAVLSISRAPGTADTPGPVAGKTTWFAVYLTKSGSGTPSAQVYDNGRCIGTVTPGAGGNSPFEQYTWIEWLPVGTGPHTITAKQGLSSTSMTVTVLPAPAGSTPDPEPSNPACDTAPATGSFGF